MEAKAVEEAMNQFEKAFNSFVNKARSWRGQRLKLSHSVASQDKELERLEAQHAERRERDKEILWRLEKVLKTLDRMGVQS